MHSLSYAVFLVVVAISAAAVTSADQSSATVFFYPNCTGQVESTTFATDPYGYCYLYKVDGLTYSSNITCNSASGGKLVFYSNYPCAASGAPAGQTVFQNGQCLTIPLDGGGAYGLHVYCAPGSSSTASERHAITVSITVSCFLLIAMSVVAWLEHFSA